VSFHIMRMRSVLKCEAMLSKQIGAVNAEVGSAQSHARRCLGAARLRTHPLPRVVLTSSSAAPCLKSICKDLPTCATNNRLRNLPEENLKYVE
jgi:hypothetical protein